jgi:hypothetical protein
MIAASDNYDKTIEASDIYKKLYLMVYNDNLLIWECNNFCINSQTTKAKILKVKRVIQE